ncbi:GGDEF domain-containing protein [Demequina salsinemoris]|uniref:GGDEF domain-containing protein n=1 Tax=Demequina salsinemoris TaxID=577470 RepID=UPI0007801E55|nr:GGDEF domain-containing protein [Demequina salsinemoris]
MRPAPAPLSPAQAIERQAEVRGFLGKVVISYVAADVLAALGMLWFVAGLEGDPGYGWLYRGTWVLVTLNLGLLIAAIRGLRRFAAMAVFFVGTTAIVVYSVTIFADANAHLLIIGLLFAAFVFLEHDQDRARWTMGIFGLAAFLYVEFLVAPGSGLVPLDSELNRDVEAVIRVAMAAHIGIDVALMQYRFVSSRGILEGVARYAELRASTDELTGLYNRRPMIERLEELAGARAGGYAVAVVDVDEFKTVNDAYGHEVGDRMIQAVAETMRKHFREGDLVSRWGGDEFLVALAGVSREDLLSLLERLREAVRSAPLECEGRSLTVTVSVGAAMGVAGGDPDDVIAAADRALYRAKEAGRDRVVVLDEPEREDARA